MRPNELLTALSVKYDGDYDKMMDAIKRREVISDEDCLEYCKKVNSNVLTILDKEYPRTWKHCIKPPLVVFYYGDISLISNETNCVSYIGSREASNYGLRTTNKICSKLAKNNYVIVSGMAKGIDTEAAKAALEANGKTVAVLGSGIDLCYPSSSSNIYKKIKDYGLVISEYPGKTKPNKENFPFRNRIIAATSSLIIVGEAKKRSGTLITVGYGLAMNKDIACVPSEACKESGSNKLIQEGAYLVDSADDALFLADEVKLGCH